MRTVKALPSLYTLYRFIRVVHSDYTAKSAYYRAKYMLSVLASVEGL